jgi:hypothetical protein
MMFRMFTTTGICLRKNNLSYEAVFIGIPMKTAHFRTCPHRNCVRIFEHNFAEGKAKKRKHTDVW